VPPAVARSHLPLRRCQRGWPTAPTSRVSSVRGAGRHPSRLRETGAPQMSFCRALLGRSAPTKPDLDALFGLPSAAITLRAAAGFRPTGSGSVAFRASEGAAFADLEKDVTELLTA